ncbi:hypothetical protein ES332_D03G035600v1 [Gossypium tomentosum]|uniref:Uncharacterized protein n=1 Tax=Gossypium tomentosum TaxID=34277 RepID=A0A5D2LKF5_GOSTO|nr:hypothetical protein ES332_D03G035600v1 [Gossypium tomentosum]
MEAEAPAFCRSGAKAVARVSGLGTGSLETNVLTWLRAVAHMGVGNPRVSKLDSIVGLLIGLRVFILGL